MYSSSSCFSAGTLVLIESGGRIPIETVVAGDKVLSLNPANGLLEARKVIDTSAQPFSGKATASPQMGAQLFCNWYRHPSCVASLFTISPWSQITPI